ncbi:hypothetical protein J4032_07000 [Streptomyces formicae]|uniref:Lipoprotein n=2 Tax=Streptomyces formicae TaxID=1616117 RepID=A0ABY3WUQ8_9ACTN|nr:hypothetical protein [Streptomyces formicae]UNM16384.1 hypothetical protein J4032_07000 [Streptomyces formicae]
MATAGALLLTGCQDAGSLEPAGATPTAVGPVQLWPELPPISAPPFDYGESDTERVPGIALRDGDIRKLDPAAVVQADVAAHPDQVGGPNGLHPETVRQLRDCASKPTACPVMKPYYRDLTGDGKDELIVGVTVTEQQTAIRAYMPEHGGITRIMADTDAVVRVELAGRDLIIRTVSAGIPGYEYRTAWSWDDQQHAMLPARDEIIRVKPSPPAPATPSPGTTTPPPTVTGPSPVTPPSPDAPPSPGATR